MSFDRAIAEEEVALTEDASSSSPRGIVGKLRAASRFSISRPIFSQAKFDDNNETAEYGLPATPWVKLKRKVHKKCYETFCSRTDCRRAARKKVLQTFPILSWLPRYNIRRDLLKDLIAGLTVGIMNIPQGMAYGKLSAVPHVYGLYTSFFPLLMYTLLGTSRHVSVGTFAVVSLMTSKIVKLQENREADLMLQSGIPSNITQDSEGHDVNIQARVGVLITVAFCVGLWQTALGILGLGSLTVYLSDQLVKGFTSGAAFHVFSSQLKPVFGLKNMTSYYGPFNLVYTYKQFFDRIGDTHVPTLIISLTCIMSLLVVKYLINENKRVMAVIKFPVPTELLVVIFGTLASWLLDLDSKYKVATVHHIPVGMPVPRIPDMKLLPEILLDSFAIAIVGFTITISLGKLFAQRFNYEIDANQELKALGVTNFFGSFFQCIPATGSLARSAVQVAVGGATQVVSIIAACFVLVVLLRLGQYLEPLPEACLGAIIMVALINLLKQVSEIGRLWKISLIDTSVFLVAFLAVLFLDVDSGLGVGVGYSLLTVILRTQRPEVGLLGRVPQTDIYKRIDSYKSALELPGIKILRLDAPLYFANADYFRRSAYELCNLDHLLGSLSEPSSPVVKSKLLLRRNTSSPTWFDHEVDPTVCIIEASSDSGTHFTSPTCNYESTADTPRSGQLLTVFEFGGTSIHHLILDCSAMCYMDVTGVEMMEKIALECRKVGVEFLLASCKAAARETLFLSGFNKNLGPDQLYLTVHDAVLFAQRYDTGKVSRNSDGGSGQA